MGSKEEKKEALREKLQLLRDATNSSAINQASIIVDASKYIQELKQKVEGLNEQIESLQPQASSSQNDPSPMVRVETLERGFLINVFSENNCPGMLVCILEAFEEVGLEVLDARVSCSDTFQLEAIGGENQEKAESIDAQVVKQAVLQAIRKIEE